jgi:predicted transcriptional regulator
MDGNYKRFYPKRMRLPRPEDPEAKAVPAALSKMQQLIIDKVKEEPGISQRAIARALNLAPSTVNYHVRMMAMAGLLRLERRVGRTKCYSDGDGACAEDEA